MANGRTHSFVGDGISRVTKSIARQFLLSGRPTEYCLGRRRVGFAVRALRQSRICWGAGRPRKSGHGPIAESDIFRLHHTPAK
jgi:hypothetical protein